MRGGFACPPGLLAAARALAREDAVRTGLDLVAATRRLSARYTQGRDALDDARRTDERYVAGLGFFLPRDVPKAAAVLDELAERDLLPRRRTLRVLDLGAGLGTTTFSLAMVARSRGLCEALEVDAVDLDPGVLARMVELAKADDPALVPVRVRPRVEDLRRGTAAAPGHDVVLFGLSLNELGEDDEAKAALLRTTVEGMADDGVVLLVEPALAATSRALMRVRDRLVEAGVPVLYPCTHTAPCPMLASDRDWCHVELPLTLDDREAWVASEAGLRDDRPTFTALALGRRATRTEDAVRVVSRPLGSKGKVELVVCGEGRLVRLRALDRDPGSPRLDSFVRGERARLVAERPLPESLRVPRDGSLRPAREP